MNRPHSTPAEVTVIIPTYNRENYIGESIDTVLSQTHPASQILIVDDGSTDNTRAIVANYHDSRIQYVSIPHAGVSAARNKGLDLATGKFIAFLDADDRWRPKMLERQLDILEQREDIVYSFTNFVRFDDASGAVLGDQFTYYGELKTLHLMSREDSPDFLLDGDAFPRIVSFGEIPAYTQCMLFRANLIRDLRFNQSLRKCEDAEFVLRATLRGRVAGTAEILADVRRHDSNMTRDISMMSLSKLEALLSIKALPDTPARSAAFNQRLIKAYIDAATTLVDSRRFAQAARYYGEALTVPGSARQKAKGLARILYTLATSFGAGRPRSRPAQ
jgi:glycosyltransferase involved in cell wall biosynthesis